jgi:transposase
VNRSQGAGGRSRQFADEWTRRYHRLGLAGLVAKRARANPPALSPEELARFKDRMKTPTEADTGGTSLRGRDAQTHLGIGVRQADDAGLGLPHPA